MSIERKQMMGALKVNSWLRAKLKQINLAEGFGVASIAKNQNINVYCPFHEDSKSSKSKSCSINGMGIFNCMACGKTGDVFDFYASVNNISRKQAIAQLTASFKCTAPAQANDVLTPIRKPTQAIVENCHSNLLSKASLKRMTYLIKERRISIDVINQFKIGCDEHRFTIPVYDEKFRLVNIRRYLPNATAMPKMVSFGKGFGQSRLYPATELSAVDKSQWLILCEGEWDCLLLRSLGYDAFTRTGGVKVWHPSFTTALRNRKVVIIFDVNDKPSKEMPEGDLGQVSAMQVADELVTRGSCQIKVVVLPLPTSYVGGDLTDYFTTFQGTKETLDTLIAETPMWEPNLHKTEEPLPVTLWEAANAEFYYKPIQLQCVVAGKGAAPFIVPRTVSFYSEDETEPERQYHTFDVWDGSLLSLINITAKQLQGTLKQLLLTEDIHRLQTEETLNIEEVFIVPTVETAQSDTNHYVLRRAFYIGHGLQTNKSYKFIGYTMPDPKSQSAIHILVDAELMDSDLDDFYIDETLHAQLVKTFSTDDPYNKLHDIAEDLAQHATHIYQRPDLHIAIDLTYHSVGSFTLDGVQLKKGWLELLVIGDTRTGKGFVAEGLRNTYQAGELVSGENLTIAGLVGGVQRLGDRWSLMWGRIPLNDRRLVTIDECTGLLPSDIAKLSRVRSEGVAEITKIISEKTTARTRLIWLGNPRPTARGSSFAIADYNYGIEAVRELIGTLEDVARFDMALVVAKDEVPSAVINKAHPAIHSRKYSPELCRQLLMWAWSRAAEDIIFEETAEASLYKFSTALAQRFSSRIPLIQGEDIRFKLARLAVAVAARTYSSPDGKRLIVNSLHMETAYNFLVTIYTKPSCGYAQLSEVERSRSGLSYGNDIKNLFKLKQKELTVFINGLLEHRAISTQDLCDMADLDIYEAKSIFSRLVMWQALIKQGSVYVKHKAFTAFLRKWKDDLTSVHFTE